MTSSRTITTTTAPPAIRPHLAPRSSGRLKGVFGRFGVAFLVADGAFGLAGAFVVAFGFGAGGAGFSGSGSGAFSSSGGSGFSATAGGSGSGSGAGTASPWSSSFNAASTLVFTSSTLSPIRAAMSS